MEPLGHEPRETKSNNNDGAEQQAKVGSVIPTQFFHVGLQLGNIPFNITNIGLNDSNSRFHGQLRRYFVRIKLRILVGYVAHGRGMHSIDWRQDARSIISASRRSSSGLSGANPDGALRRLLSAA